MSKPLLYFVTASGFQEIETGNPYGTVSTGATDSLRSLRDDMMRVKTGEQSFCMSEVKW